MFPQKREFLKFSLLNLFLFPFIKFNLKATDLKNTKVLTNFIFFEHLISPDHPEKPDRIKYILNNLKKK